MPVACFTKWFENGLWEIWAPYTEYLLEQAKQLNVTQSPTSVVLTDRKRTAQILRTKTLRVLRNIKKEIEIFFLVLILPQYSESARKCCNF